MSDISYSIRIDVIRDVVTRAREVGSYQAVEWLEHHMKYLETQNNERSIRHISGKDDNSS